MKIYSSIQINQKTKQEQNAQKKIYMRDMVYMMQRDPRFRNSPLLYESLVRHR
jgi:hypothetical protein